MLTHYHYHELGKVYRAKSGIRGHAELVYARPDITPKKLAQLLQQAYNQGRKDLKEQINEIKVRIDVL